LTHYINYFDVTIKVTLNFIAYHNNNFKMNSNTLVK